MCHKMIKRSILRNKSILVNMEFSDITSNIESWFKIYKEMLFISVTCVSFFPKISNTLICFGIQNIFSHLSLTYS